MAGRRRRELSSRVLFTQPITPVAGQPVDIFYNPGGWLKQLDTVDDGWTLRCIVQPLNRCCRPAEEHISHPLCAPALKLHDSNVCWAPVVICPATVALI